MAAAVAVPVRYGRAQVGTFWSAVRAVDDVAAAIERECAHANGHTHGMGRRQVEAVTAGVVRLRRSLAEVTDTARAAGLPPADADRVDETSQRWVTAVHEAGHAVVTGALGHRVKFAGVSTDETGLTSLDIADRRANDPAYAVVCVSGERATRLLLGVGGGSGTDYRDARTALARTGRSIEWAEQHADQIIHERRRDLIQLARRLYRDGRENNINSK